jgi:hypothetical protein
LSCVVIDDLELLVDWNPIGPRFSTGMLSALKSLLTRKPPKERRYVIHSSQSISSAVSVGFSQEFSRGVEPRSGLSRYFKHIFDPGLC